MLAIHELKRHLNYHCCIGDIVHVDADLYIRRTSPNTLMLMRPKQQPRRFGGKEYGSAVRRLIKHLERSMDDGQQCIGK